jgi:hypothetical protein
MRRSIKSLITISASVVLAGVFWPTDAHAQRGRAVRVGPTRVVRTYVYRPYYYGGYYSPFFWGSPWGPYGFYPSVWYSQYPRYRYVYDEASLRIQVSPKQAQVYVDGFFVGTVDSFDGTFQRLHVSPGEHLIEVFLEGHRTIRETMMFQPREGYQIRRAMEPLGPGEAAPDRPRPDPSARRAGPSYTGETRRDPYYEPRGQLRGEAAGSVAIRVQPGGATIFVDGEKWDVPEGSDPLVIQLSEGTHRLEVQRQGYRTFMTEVRIRRGETVPLNINLRKEGGLATSD